MSQPSPQLEASLQAAPLVVDLDQVSVRYGDTYALRDVSLSVGAGERVALVGPSGAGKSTLLRLCGAALTPTSGEVSVHGLVPAGLQGRSLRRLRANIGTVHQQLELVDRLRVVHNVNAGRLAQWSRRRALWSLMRPQGVEDVGRALASVGIADKLYERTERLSGGEQQRVALARVLLQGPGLVLADEPIASLDPARGREVMDLLCDVGTVAGSALIVSLHTFALALSHCDRVIGLRNGSVVFDAPAAEVTDAMAASLYRLEP